MDLKRIVAFEKETSDDYKITYVKSGAGENWIEVFEDAYGTLSVMYVGDEDILNHLNSEKR
jgi:hypothetical protein